jgi:hypothetical protein
MCNNNRPGLTPEQKMVNAIFHSTIGEDVYKEEQPAVAQIPLDPDTEGEYMMDVCRYLRCMTDDLEEIGPEDFGSRLDHIGYVMEVLRAVMAGSITGEQLKDIEEWQQYLEVR